LERTSAAVSGSLKRGHSIPPRTAQDAPQVGRERVEEVPAFRASGLHVRRHQWRALQFGFQLNRITCLDC
jgi:hypothetical protein